MHPHHAHRPLFALLALAVCRAPLCRADPVTAALQPFLDRGEIAGAVTLVANRDRVLHCAAIGWANLERRVPIATNSLFWIASMTKPLTAALVLSLCDEGRCTLDDPLARWLPEFRGLTFSNGAPAEPMPTLRHLLTHTSGLDTPPPTRWDAPLSEIVAASAARPLHFPPGSRWEYCNGGINALGRVVEVIEQAPFAEVLQRRLLEPLGMTDTTFWPDEDAADRLATAYEPDGAGGLRPTGIFFLQGPLTDRRRTPLPAGGLFSTAADYAKFLQMLLNGGVTPSGRRILSEAAVREMTRTQTGDLKTGFVDGMSFGLGVGVVREPRGVTAALSPGTFGHGGAYGTQAWADPVRGRLYILLIQRAKLPNADGSEIRAAFQAAAAALPEPPADTTR
ncbi:MAG: beta-lactamase family protein [Kiritimatiellae bacterium]|nr:beta-lactamase family protein [Kiritimatiellia bacterium]